MNAHKDRLGLNELPKPRLEKANAIITLGRVDNYGYLNIDAHERIRYTVELFKQKLAPYVIAPAKWSYKLNYTPPRTESAVIKSRLIEWGIPSDSILMEEKSCDTLGAAYFLRTLFTEPRSWESVIIITSLDHYERTKFVFEKVFGNTNLNLQYSWGNQVFCDKEFDLSLEREARSLKLMEETWIGPIEPGNLEQIKHVLQKHPGYNPAAKLTSQDIERLIQSQNIDPNEA